METTKDKSLYGIRQSPARSSPSVPKLSTFDNHLLHCASEHAAPGIFPHTATTSSFKGVLIDTGAASASSGSFGQINGYCTLICLATKTDRARRALVRLGIEENTPLAWQTYTFQFKTPGSYSTYILRTRQLQYKSASKIWTPTD